MDHAPQNSLTIGSTVRAGLICIAIILLPAKTAISEPYTGISSQAFEPLQYSGTMTCDGRSYVIELMVEDAGAFTLEDYHMPCRSGSGPCNEQYENDFANSRHIAASVVISDPETRQKLYERSNLTGEILFWWPGRAEGAVWGSAPLEDVEPKPHRTISLWDIPVPRYEERALNSDFLMVEYRDRDTGKEEISSTLSTPICEQVDLNRISLKGG